MSNTTFVDYELMTKHFDDVLHVAIPREGLPESFTNANCAFDEKVLIVKYNGVTEQFVDVPGPIKEEIISLGKLHFIDLDRDIIHTLPVVYGFI